MKSGLAMQPRPDSVIQCFPVVFAVRLLFRIRYLNCYGLIVTFNLIIAIRMLLATPLLRCLAYLQLAKLLLRWVGAVSICGGLLVDCYQIFLALNLASAAPCLRPCFNRSALFSGISDSRSCVTNPTAATKCCVWVSTRGDSFTSKRPQ